MRYHVMQGRKVPAAVISLLTALVWTVLWNGNLQAAVAPNGQLGECGPYYLWYQTSLESYPPSLDYLYLCGITFDISDVVNDFDFVYFTDNENFQRAALDKDRDGVSDLFFEGRTQNKLSWRPPRGCVRVDLRQCQAGSGFREECGYAMISVQPKRGFRDGSARIAIGVSAKCPPNGVDCSRSYEFVHRYANCFEQSLPEFIIQKKANKELASNDYAEKEEFQFTLTVRNTSQNTENNTVLTDVTSTGTKGGNLRLFSFDFDCPATASCHLIGASSTKFTMSLSNIPPDRVVTVKYKMLSDKNEISDDVISYFTSTATLSTGQSDRMRVGVRGMRKGSPEPEPERREENPIESSL
jgi:hypothetical protein